MTTMSAAPAQILVPSLLSDDVADWVRVFAQRIRDEVALPLFSAKDTDAFD